MTRITVNDAVLGALGAAPEEAELFDVAGRRVGYFLADDAYRRLICRWANAQVSEEELERCRHETESYTTAEALERLRNLLQALGRMYTVRWKRSASNRLAELWAQADDRAAITAAVDEIDCQLALHPNDVGESHSAQTRTYLHHRSVCSLM